MPTPESYYLKGNLTEPVMTARSIKRRADGLDAGTATFISLNEDEFTLDAAISQLRGMRAREIDTDQDGVIYEHKITVEGLLGNSERRPKGYPQITTNLTDWDRIEDSVITRNPNRFTAGQTGSYGGNAVCVTAVHHELFGGIYEWKASFIGLISSKPRQRTITVNGQTISSDKITVTLPGGWTTPKKGVAQLPKVVCRDSYFGFTPPPAF